MVAEEGGELLSCVQIFPRPVRIRGHAVPMGGIGSVFTHPEHRGRGHASGLLDFATQRMLERGIEVSLLFGVRPMYPALGWKVWDARGHLLSREGPPRAAPAGLRLASFDPRRDLTDVRALHESYSGSLDGTVVRDDPLWETSLRVAGNPEEEFLVARRDGRLVAYARAMVSESFLAISEVGRTPEGADALAALFERILTPREEDALAPADRPSSLLRSLVAFRPPPDPGLEGALRARGIAARVVDDPTVKWRCLDPLALSRRLGLPLEEGEDPEAYLRRVLPPDACVFWPSDRF